VKLYEIVVNGVKHVAQYEDKDAPKGAKPLTAAQAKEPRGKARTPRNKGA